MHAFQFNPAHGSHHIISGRGIRTGGFRPKGKYYSHPPIVHSLTTVGTKTHGRVGAKHY